MRAGCWKGGLIDPQQISGRSLSPWKVPIRVLSLLGWQGPTGTVADCDTLSGPVAVNRVRKQTAVRQPDITQGSTILNPRNPQAIDNG
ncbi:MAG: hypothetical protein CBD74_02780 [Saprospirales bacterium TMED214]|nr:MAG: hypothetical protein CBD74_02780 [Saprospirales bacterium TMED214]